MSNKQPLIDDDVDAGVKATPAQLTAIVNKAREQKTIENKIEKLEEQIAKEKKKLLLIRQNELPKLMRDASMSECPLGNGWSVAVNTIVTASIPSPDNNRVENAAEKNKVGITYLRKVAPDLLRNQILIEFDLKEEKFFKKVIADIQKRKRELDYSVKTMVHGGTLGKWVRGQDALGKAVDEIALNVHRITQTDLVPPKDKGKKVKI